jgi:hypothetical protein
MSDVTEAIRAFYESRIGDFAEPRIRIGGGSPLQCLVGPDDCEPVPPAVFEAVGFYFVNVLEQDNGSVFVFRSEGGGRFTYGVLATTNGSSSHLEVYAQDGTFLVAGIPDWTAGAISWKDREQVRRHAAMWG